MARSLFRFWSDRRGGAVVDHAMLLALLFATGELAAAHAAPLSAAVGLLLTR